MMKLLKVNDRTWETENKEYRLEKGWASRNKKMVRVFRLYRNDEYIGQPESVKVANEWIKNR